MEPVLVDGRPVRVAGYERGNFVGATVLELPTATGELGQTEIFGPVLSLTNAATLDDAIAIVNASAFGNMACIFTTSGAAARKFRYETRVGNVGVNVGTPAPMAFFPFAGSEGQLLRRPARAGQRRDRLLHGQEGRRRTLAERVVAAILMVSSLAPETRRRMVVRAVVASAVGTTIEWYDFFLYGVAAATVFPQTFFPESDPFVGTLLGFSTYFVGFAARPIGAAIFGHYGDRVGRKSLLIITMMMMGVSTVGIGLVPSYETIGDLGRGAADDRPRDPGPQRRRRVERLGADGRRVDRPEGARLHDQLRAVRRAGRDGARQRRAGADDAPDHRGAVPRVGLAGALPCEHRARLRRPLHPDRRARDAGVLAAEGARDGVEGARDRRAAEQLARSGLTALLRTGQQVPFYIFTTYIITYATQQLGFSRGLILSVVMIQSFISMLTIPLMGHLSDLYGRRTITAIGCVVMMVLPFVYFGLLDTRVPCRS